jgi:hypothetical protein
MAMDFPSNPTNGQTYTPPSGRPTYTWNGYAWATTGTAGPPAGVDYVDIAGDTMTGFLTLSADPVAPLHAATKQYIDVRAVPPPAVGNDGEALVALTGASVWGAAINAGSF